MVIGLITEGHTDRVVLEEVLYAVLPGEDHRFLPLQPANPPNTTGAGWKGVRQWCYETWRLQGSSLEMILSSNTGDPIDLLVIAVDGDIVTELDLQEGIRPHIPRPQPLCPPASRSAAWIQSIVRYWLNRPAGIPGNIVFAIPCQDMETWTFAALYPADQLCLRDDYECIGSGGNHPGYRLSLAQYGKHIQRKDGTLKKSVVKYRALAQTVAANWADVSRICSQADTFTSDIKIVLSVEHGPGSLNVSPHEDHGVCS